MTINEQFKEYGVVPVVVLNDAKDALPLAKALVEGGLACADLILSEENRSCSGSSTGRCKECSTACKGTC